jgi:hypothetical protein
MHFKVKLISPHDAAKMLEKRALNRRLDESTVLMYARDMENGHWRQTGEPIIVSEKGEVIDGQHRLAAIAKYGKAVEMVVCYGIPSDAMGSIDRNRPRSIAQVLQIADGMVEMLRRDSGCLLKLSVDEVRGIIDANPGIAWVMSAPRAVGKTRKTLSPILAAFAIAYQKDAAKTADAWNQFHEGAGIRKGDPILALGRWLDNPASTQGTSGARLSLARRALTVLAYRFQNKDLFRAADGTDGVRFFLSDVIASPKTRKAPRSAAA